MGCRRPMAEDLREPAARRPVVPAGSGRRAAAPSPRAGAMPCCPSGPTTRLRRPASSARPGSAPRADRQLPGAEVQSESCSRTVPPGPISALRSATTDDGVAAALQSRPQAVHSTVRSPRRRAASNDPPDTAPYGGRNHTGSVAVAVSDAVTGPLHVAAHPARGPSQVAGVGVAVQADLVAPRRHLGRQRRVPAHHAPEHEEGGPPPEPVELVQERGGRGRVGAVVEGEGEVTGVAEAGQRRRGPAPEGPPAAHRGRHVGHTSPGEDRAGAGGEPPNGPAHHPGHEAAAPAVARPSGVPRCIRGGYRRGSARLRRTGPGPPGPSGPLAGPADRIPLEARQPGTGQGDHNHACTAHRRRLPGPGRARLRRAHRGDRRAGHARVVRNDHLPPAGGPGAGDGAGPRRHGRRARRAGGDREPELRPAS